MNDIEIIKQVIYTEQGEKMSYIDIDNIIDNECENFIQAIENLIQRNKDLEQIEQKHKEENGRLRDKIKELEETLKCTQKSWFEDTKKIEKYKMLEANIAKANEIIKDGIPKSLVKEKMQELDKEEKEAQESISDEEREEYSDASIGYLLMNIETRRNVLQELLEESD